MVGMDVTVLASSAVIAAVVSGLISFFTQRRLLDRKAQVDYNFAARRRLYEAIGPLRLQLLFSAKDVIARITGHPGTRWDMNASGHFVRSFIYRLLRPLAIGQLIERQMSIADFSVDPTALELLRFNATIERMLSGPAVVLEHPEVDWSTQSQHLFRDNLRATAAKLIVSARDEMSFVMDYARFADEVPDPLADSAFRDLALIFDRCGANLAENSIFWLRLVGYGFGCTRLLESHGAELGFEARSYQVGELLGAVDDRYVSSRVSEYSTAFEEVVNEPL